MNKIYFILLATILAVSVEGRIFRIIDDFTDTPYIARYVPPAGEVYDTDGSYTWFSPYTNPAGYSPGAPFTNFRGNLPNVMGGQRDIIIGHISEMPTRASITCAINRATGATPANFQLSLPTNFIGGIYLQYDGVDNSTAALGSRLGFGIGSDGGSGSNADGTVDFTFGGFAKGILISVQTDLLIDYELKAVNIGDDTTQLGAGNFIDFLVDRNEITGFTRFYFTYADPDWADTPANFDWTRVAGFQVKVFTDQGSPTAQSLDSRIFLIQIGTFQVGGTVRADCLCDNAGLVPLSGIVMNLFRTSVSTTVPFATATTGADGTYLFIDQFPSNGGFIDTTIPYRICLADNTLTRCPSTQPNTQNGCYDFFTTDPFVDLLNFDYTISRSTSIEIPPPRSLECNVDSTLPANTGFAFATDCSGNRVQINTWIDNPTTSNCVTTIRRTWTDPSSLQSGVQTITVTDTRAPSFSTPPSPLTQSCGTLTTSLSQWVSSNAGAVGTDLCAFSRITNNWNQQQLNGCGTVTVAFTAVDVCGLTSAPQSAQFTVTSTSGPTINPQASNLNVECNFQQQSQNPNTQITNWINAHGNAVATDGCTAPNALTWTDSFSDTTITPANACTFTEAVTFTVTNGCGASSRTTATIQVRDTVGPVISPQASDQPAQCSLTGSNDQAFQAWRAAHGNAQATDACTTNAATLTWTDNYTGGAISGSCSGTTTVTFTVFDACGRSSATTATFRITDTEPPRIVTQASNRDSPCSASGNVADYNSWLQSNGGASATDNCGSVVWTNNAPVNPPAPCSPPVSVTFTATQLCSPPLSVTTIATFRVTDSTPPTFQTPPTSDAAECGPSAPSAFTTWLAGNAGAVGVDTCSSTVTITNNFQPPNLSNGCNNVATVQFAVRDTCNNISPVQTASFTIRDTTAPVINVEASPQSVECNANTNGRDYSTWISNHGGATATDSCFSSLQWSINDTTPIVASCLTQRFIQFTVSDPCNNRDTTVSSFTITDSQPPTLTSQARDRSVECTGTDANSDLASWLANNGGAAATDNCGAVTWTNTFVALDSNCVSVNPVTFFASDSCGRQVSTTATFSYSDTQPPVITRQAQAQTVECSATNNNAFQTFLDTHGGAQARDACSPASALVWTNTFAQSPQGCSSALVTFTVADACGLTSSTVTTFTIVDTTRPVFSPPPVDLTVQCDESNQAAYDDWLANHGGANVIDECAVSITWTHNGTSTAPDGCGRRVVVFTAEDNCNNSVFATATFRVTDTQGPSFISLAQNQTVECDADGNQDQLNNFLNTRGGATAIDDCYGDQIIWSNNFGGQLGVTRCSQFATVTFRAADPCGATSQTTATFVISDTTPPEITKQATTATFECNDDVNGDQIDEYLITHGGSSAVDTCTVVTWTDDFLDTPIECSGPIRVVFTAADVCGNVVQTFGSVEIVDSVKPKFLDFPDDITLGCDRGTDPEETGIPTGFDACDDEPSITYSDEQIQLPDDFYCPGDIITYRTWYIRDNCGNTDFRQQLITTEFAFTSDPCTPAECPTCRLNVCCPAVIDRVACNPVPCTPVACTTVGCTTVPCIPNTDCEVIYYPDDDAEPPAPQPSILPAPSCEPVYIYIFDDDGPEDPDVYRADSQSTSSVLAVSVFLLLLSLLML